jgi:hypothetical protein
MKHPVGNKTIKNMSNSYVEIMWKYFFEMKNNLKLVEPLDLQIALQFGMYLVDHVFWFVSHYSNNLELSIFASDRAKLLYIEFLQMSRQNEIMRQSNSFPSIFDAFNFSIRKSIGTIQIDNHKFFIHKEKNSIIRNNIRSIIDIFNLYYNPKENTEWSEEIYSKIYESFVVLWTSSIMKTQINFDKIGLFIKNISCVNLSFVVIDWCIMHPLDSNNPEALSSFIQSVSGSSIFNSSELIEWITNLQQNINYLSTSPS